jgi:hypothetical protein
MRVAVVAGLPVHCDAASGTPRVPQILLLPSFDAPDFALTDHVPAGSLDWIISVHALNNKLAHDRCHVPWPSLVRTLARGGTALVHVGSLATTLGRRLLGHSASRTFMRVPPEAVPADLSLFMVLHKYEVMMVAHRATDAADRAAFERPFLRSTIPSFVVLEYVWQLEDDLERPPATPTPPAAGNSTDRDGTVTLPTTAAEAAVAADVARRTATHALRTVRCLLMHFDKPASWASLLVPSAHEQMPS